MLVVCDLQGVLNGEGRFQKFQLTDPAICSLNEGRHRYGNTDLGSKGIGKWCRRHRCNNVCEALGLPHIDPQAPVKIEKPIVRAKREMKCRRNQVKLLKAKEKRRVQDRLMREAESAVRK